jgi:hypothetical protein
MRKISITSVLLLFLITTSILNLEGQTGQASKVVFLNAPVLFRENGKSFQQIVADYRSDTPGKIIFFVDGKESL